MAKSKKIKRRVRRASRPKRAIKAARHPRRGVRLSAGRARLAVSRPAPVVDPRVARALKEYARAMKQFNQQNYRTARRLLTRLLDAPSREVAERARVHLNICEQRLTRPEQPRLRSGDDYYNYGVSLTNLGRLEEARGALEKARKLLPKADYVHYALAARAALAGEADPALEHLKQAIRLRPENRFQVRNDLDFQSIETDPRFVELVYSDRPPTR